MKIPVQAAVPDKQNPALLATLLPLALPPSLFLWHITIISFSQGLQQLVKEFVVPNIQGTMQQPVLQ